MESVGGSRGCQVSGASVATLWPAARPGRLEARGPWSLWGGAWSWSISPKCFARVSASVASLTETPGEWASPGDAAGEMILIIIIIIKIPIPIYLYKSVRLNHLASFGKKGPLEACLNTGRLGDHHPQSNGLSQQVMRPLNGLERALRICCAVCLWRPQNRPRPRSTGRLRSADS